MQVVHHHQSILGDFNVEREPRRLVTSVNGSAMDQVELNCTDQALKHNGFKLAGSLV
jgi:hypothetical protein